MNKSSIILEKVFLLQPTIISQSFYLNFSVFHFQKKPASENPKIYGSLII